MSGGEIAVAVILVALFLGIGGWAITGYQPAPRDGAYREETQRRVALGLSQAELARLIRVHRRPPSRSYVSRLESGKIDPPVAVVRSLARALRCHPWQLIAEIYENVSWWDDYLALAPVQKREIQRMVKWYLERRSC